MRAHRVLCRALLDTFMLQIAISYPHGLKVTTSVCVHTSVCVCAYLGDLQSVMQRSQIISVIR